MSTVPKVDFPTTYGSTVVCIESHLIAGLGLPPSKFFVAIMNFLRYELVHFNTNAIVALSYFSMLCECWLGIPLDTSLFWYFYFPAQYNKVVYSEIGLSLRCHRSQEYIDATFKSSWSGSLSRWFLVNMYVGPQWVNMHMLPLFIDDKRVEPKMTPRLTTLVKWVAELHDTGLRACHCAEEFTHRQIRPLGHWEKLAFECPRLADPSHEPASGKIFILSFYYY
jgi:hypothetical protein